MSNNLGFKIKNLREAASISLEDMATEAGVSAEQQSQIEAGEVIPAISKLAKYAKALGVRVGTLLDGTESVTPIITRNRKASQTERLVEEHEGTRTHMNYYSLSSGKSDGSMEPYIVNIGYFEATKENFLSHEGEEFMYVLEGGITLYYGTDIYELKEGDSIYYDSVVPHCVSSSSEGENARVLAVMYTPY